MRKQEILDSSYDDLLTLKSWVEAVIDLREKEQKVKLWELVVDNYAVCYGTARESVLEVAEQILKDERGKQDDVLSLRVSPMYVRDSEVDGYLEM